MRKKDHGRSRLARRRHACKHAPACRNTRPNTIFNDKAEPNPQTHAEPKECALKQSAFQDYISRDAAFHLYKNVKLITFTFRNDLSAEDHLARISSSYNRRCSLSYNSWNDPRQCQAYRDALISCLQWTLNPIPSYVHQSQHSRSALLLTEIS